MSGDWSVGAGLEGRGVIVTGAAQGIGRATAEGVAQAGGRVLVVDRNGAALEEVLAGLEGTGHAAAAVDLTDLDSHGELVRQARAELGGLWGIAHFAGVLRRRPDLASITEEDWDIQHEVNLKASFFLCRAVGLALQEDGTEGRIVTVSSQGWQSGGFGGSVVYAASKGGIVSMTRGLARSLGPCGHLRQLHLAGQHRHAHADAGSRQERARLDQSQHAARPPRPARRGRERRDLPSLSACLVVSGATLNVSGAFLMY